MPIDCAELFQLVGPVHEIIRIFFDEAKFVFSR
jgi:hypothetical protein